MGHLAGQSPPTGPVRLYGCIDYELVCLQARSQACAFRRLRMRDVVHTQIFVRARAILINEKALVLF